MACPSSEIANSDYSGLGSVAGIFEDVVNVSCNEGYFGGGNWTCSIDESSESGISFTGNSCELCGPGTYSGVGQTSCTPCAAGYTPTLKEQ